MHIQTWLLSFASQLINDRFQVFQRFPSSTLILKAVETRFATLINCYADLDTASYKNNWQLFQRFPEVNWFICLSSKKERWKWLSHSHTYIHACIHVCMRHTYMFACIHVCTHTCMYAWHVCVHVCVTVLWKSGYFPLLNKWGRYNGSQRFQAK